MKVAFNTNKWKYRKDSKLHKQLQLQFTWIDLNTHLYLGMYIRVNQTAQHLSDIYLNKHFDIMINFPPFLTVNSSFSQFLSHIKTL